MLKKSVACLYMFIYRVGLWLLLPLMVVLLLYRWSSGKEIAARVKERFAVTKLVRPCGRLIWMHAASIGELNLALALVCAMQRQLKNNTDVNFLVTTQTVSAAMVFEKKAIKNCIHQFFPFDIRFFCKSFLKKWKPDVVIFLESEIWPEMISNIECPLYLANARMSYKSYKMWKKHHSFATYVFGKFKHIFSATLQDGEYFCSFAGGSVQYLGGNLKQAIFKLSHDKVKLQELRQAYGSTDKPYVVLASISVDEVKPISQVVNKLLPSHNIVLIPRHKSTAKIIVKQMKKLKINYTLRSKNQLPINSSVYIADTYNELGLFYELADCIVVGGSFGRRQGQNMLEAVKFDKPVIVGANISNFMAIMQNLLVNKTVVQVRNMEELFQAITQYSYTSEERDVIIKNARRFNEQQSMVMKKYMQYFIQYVKVK